MLRWLNNVGGLGVFLRESLSPAFRASDTAGGVWGGRAVSIGDTSTSTERRDLIDGVGDPDEEPGLLHTSPGVSGTRISNSEPLFGPETSERRQNKSPPSLRANPFA